jgi:CheY-like chemotaxis protein
MSRTVLIVEDSEQSAETLELALLTTPGVTVRRVSNGAEALAFLSSPGNLVCALLTDLHMPSIDGFELVRQVRSSPFHAGLPIIVVSGDTDPATPERIRGLGADAYFSKPFSPAQVRQTLERLLEASCAPDTLGHPGVQR